MTEFALSPERQVGTAIDQRQTVILLGASNLTLGWKPMLRALQQTVPGDIDLRVCLGMGRSYIDWSAVLFRRLPGIVQCGLWENLPASGSKSPLVLMTDIGNDIAYSRAPEQIFQTVQECRKRILAWRPEARIAMSGLPLESVESVGKTRFLLMRTIMFPGCTMSFQQICHRSRALNRMLENFVATNGIPFVNPEGRWYRMDPIHVIPPLREMVFRKFFSLWNLDSSSNSGTSERPIPSLPATAVRTVAGLARRTSQPVFQSPRLVVSAW